MKIDKGSLIAIVGPTGSGKSDLALDLAVRFNGEIICADSRTIYRGMDIGTAKPSLADQARVQHHLLDILDPDQDYSAAEFKLAAIRAIDDIRTRGKLPILVGGTGLYAYAVLYDYQFPAGARTKQRAELELLPIADLVERLQLEDPERASEIDLHNPRRVIRALETVGQPQAKTPMIGDGVILIGLRPSDEVLNTSIAQRTYHMLQIGLVEEVQKLIDRYGTEIEVLKSPGYCEIVDYLAHRTILEQAEALITLHTRQLVKRQLTWFKRNADIRWVDSQAAAIKVLEEA